MRFNRRSRTEIIVNILKAAEYENKKTQIMYKARLSFKQLEDYLSFLEERGLIKNRKGNNGKVIGYKTSDKGRKFLRGYKELISLITSNNSD